MDANKEEIQHEFFPFLRVYASGRLERILETDVLPPGLDPDTGVVSKDVVVDVATGVTARLYLPPAVAENEKLPVLVYYHGGGFVIETASSPTYHNYLNSLVAKAKVVAVSVDYRRVPEVRLPVSYDDSWAALRWAVSVEDPWLAEHGDFDRLFLAGDSAGANIVHNMAMRAAAGDGLPKLKGIALVHPYFWGKEAVGSEPKEGAFRERMEYLWQILCPSANAGADDPLLRPVGLERLACERVLVSVAQKDFLRERGVDYYERLKRSGWGGDAELVETEEAEHVFHLRDRGCDAAAAEMARMVAFLNGK